MSSSISADFSAVVEFHVQSSDNPMLSAAIQLHKSHFRHEQIF